MDYLAEILLRRQTDSTALDYGTEPLTTLTIFKYEHLRLFSPQLTRLLCDLNFQPAGMGLTWARSMNSIDLHNDSDVLKCASTFQRTT